MMSPEGDLVRFTRPENLQITSLALKKGKFDTVHPQINHYYSLSHLHKHLVHRESTFSKLTQRIEEKKITHFVRKMF